LIPTTIRPTRSGRLGGAGYTIKDAHLATKISLSPMKPLRLSSIVLCFILAAGNAAAQPRELSNNGELLDRIAAVVNEGVVLRSELEEQTESVIERLREQQTELPPRNVLRRQILERLVVEEIQMQRADRLGIQVTDE